MPERKFTERAGRGHISRHQGQGLVWTVLAPPQLPQRRGVAGVTGQLEAAQALERQNAALQQNLTGAGQGVALVVPRGAGVAIAGHTSVHKPETGAADRTGRGLGVEAPVGGRGVFRRAMRAERKTAHGGGGPVIGNGAGDGVARPAIGAVGESIAITAVGRIAHVRKAVRADAHIRADQHAVPGMAVAGHNGKGRFAGQGRQFLLIQPRQPGQGRQFRAQTATEARHLFRRALHLHAHAVRGIAHRAGEPAFLRQPVDKGAKAHALHLPGGHKSPARCLFHIHYHTVDQKEKIRQTDKALRPGVALLTAA